jgi:septal ring factor EnvC (AmiA/AmiB activator)
MEEIKGKLDDVINGLAQTRDTMRDLMTELRNTQKALYSLSERISKLNDQE